MPEWAALPLSGAGAAVNGGRFNRPGVEALYLSVDPVTALAEYRQGASITPPGTSVAYQVDVAGL
jgi:RES domain-containing protein